MEWETGYLVKTSRDDRKEDLKFDYRQDQNFRPGIIVIMIIAQIRTREDNEAEVPRSTVSEARQGYGCEN